MSETKVCKEYWKEWAGWSAQKDVPYNVISAPELGDFCALCLGLG